MRNSRATGTGTIPDAERGAGTEASTGAARSGPGGGWRVALGATLAVLAAAVAAACGDGSTTSPPRAGVQDGPAASPAAGVRASLAVGAFEEGEQTVSLRLEGRESGVGAYQGRILFDPGRLELLSTGNPEQGFHVVNDRRAGEGQVRFAGFAVEGFSEPTVLELRFRTDGPLAAGDLELVMEALGTDGGAPVPSERISVDEELVRAGG